MPTDPVGTFTRGVCRRGAAMRLTAWEEERLLIFTAAELARRHRDRGLRLNAPEVIEEGIRRLASIGARLREVVGVREVLTLDRPKIWQVFNNLLSNAIKFTPAGGRIATSV